MPIRVLIVDPHEIMRAGIKQACNDREDLEFVGETNSLARACVIARQSSADVAIVDPESAGRDGEGLETIGRLHQEFPDLKILIFTASDGPQHAARFVEAGASGYLIKTAGLDAIAVAIRSVHVGRIFISHSRGNPATAKPPLTLHTVTNNAKKPIDKSDPFPGPPLSAREQEVLSMIVDGMTNKQVAESLYLSVKTVETYRARIMKKHGLRDRSELVRFARKMISDVSQPA